MHGFHKWTDFQELRRRFRYLSHLSDGQSFSLVLLDSRNLNLNEETFLKFKNQITARNKKRVQKDKEESKATKKIEVQKKIVKKSY